MDENGETAERQRRLAREAAALRENLRRRKAAQRRPDDGAAQPEAIPDRPD